MNSIKSVGKSAAICLALCFVPDSLAIAGEVMAKDVLHPDFSPSQEFGNVFSRTIAFNVPGYDDVVRRVSGTAAYRVTKTSQEETVLDGRFVYDGNPVSTGLTTIKDGGRTLCWNQQCSPSTDASGVSINPALWGNPPEKLHVGASWIVNIQTPWELGPPGQQTVTVVAIDQKSGSVRLKREGSGEGAFADDIKRIPLKSKAGSMPADLQFHNAHWTGYATFSHGIVVSDTLFVERPFTANANGQTVSGIERQYILLNASDPQLLWH